MRNPVLEHNRNGDHIRFRDIDDAIIINTFITFIQNHRTKFLYKKEMTFPLAHLSVFDKAIVITIDVPQLLLAYTIDNSAYTPTIVYPIN